MPAVEEIVITKPERWPRTWGRAARVTLTGPNKGGLDLRAERLGRHLLEEAGLEVAGMVDQHVEPAKPIDGGGHGDLTSGR
jgi:hypothetical protein